MTCAVTGGLHFQNAPYKAYQTPGQVGTDLTTGTTSLATAQLITSQKLQLCLEWL